VKDTCKLCGREDMLRDSHILPEFLYHLLYDEKHRAVGINPLPGQPEQFLQKGLREPLLCGGCEIQLSVVEKYAARVLRNLPDMSRTEPGQVVRVKDIDYAKFKLFQLSLIWRAGVAQQLSFASVDLGPHEARLREMIRKGCPGGSLDYPCLLIGTRGPGTLERLMKLPMSDRLMDHRVYHMLLVGIVWAFFVSKHTRAIREKDSFLSETGILPINISSDTAESFIAGLGYNLKQAGLL
jgi:hypothetical protein